MHRNEIDPSWILRIRQRLWPVTIDGYRERQRG
jgi:hypothetical protein